MRLPYLWIAMLALSFIACKKDKETIVAADTVKTDMTICYDDFWSSQQEFQGLAPGANFVYNNKVYFPAYYDTHTADNKVAIFDGTTWTSKPCNISFLTAVCPFYFTIGNKGYITDFFLSHKRMYAYDFATNTFTRKADFPGRANTATACFVIGNKAYVVGGMNDEDGHYTNENWEYNPATNTWTERQGLFLVRGYASGFSIDGKGYIINGKYPDDLGFYSSLAQYDPVSDSWTTKAVYPGMGRQNSQCFVIDGKAYVGGGFNNNPNSFIRLKDFYRYTPSTDTWTRVKDLPVEEPFTQYSFTLNEKGYSIYLVDGQGAAMRRYSPEKCTYIIPSATSASTIQ